MRRHFHYHGSRFNRNGPCGASFNKNDDQKNLGCTIFALSAFFTFVGILELYESFWGGIILILGAIFIPIIFYLITNSKAIYSRIEVESDKEKNFSSNSKITQTLSDEELPLIEQIDEKIIKEQEYIKNKIQYLKENRDKIAKLAQKYERPFYNYLNQCGDIELDFFALFSFIFRREYHENTIRGKLLRKLFEKDEIKFDVNSPNNYIGKLRQLTDTFSNGLRQRIIQNHEWDDEETFDSALFLILRSIIIKQKHDEYLSTVGYESLEDLYLHKKLRELPTDFTLYYIYETNISLPISETHRFLYRKYSEIREKMQEKEMEHDLFETNLSVSVTTQKTVVDQFQAELPTKKTIDTIDVMSGREFEEFVADLFKRRGYNVTLTPSSGDFGIDVIIENEFARIGIQTKCYNEKVPNSAVQEAVTGIRHYNLDKAMVITNNYFLPSAIELARDNNVILWDRNKLIQEIGK